MNKISNSSQAINNNFRENSTNKFSLIATELVSQTPGRIRVRILSKHRNNPAIASIINTLKERIDIYKLRFNPSTGSITIFYVQDHINFTIISNLLTELGLSLVESSPQFYTQNRQSEAALKLTNLASFCNKKMEQATQGKIDLRFLIPLGFGVLAIRQLLIKGIMLEAIPWYVLAWYSFDSFIKLHYSDGS